MTWWLGHTDSVALKIEVFSRIALEPGVQKQAKMLAGLVSPGLTTVSSSHVLQDLAFVPGKP